MEIELNERTDGHKAPEAKRPEDRVTDDWLKRLSDLECDRMTLVIEGALAVQGGLQTRALDERLRALVPDDLPQQKEKVKAA